MAEKITNIQANTEASAQASAQPSTHSNIALASQDDGIEMLAKIAGLEGALARFPEDVVTAAKTALNIRAAFQAPLDNTAELWPVMQVKS
jgi:alpha-D-ribose 1-methylphosphonate 5-triphosphate diphosphatase PhnM